jgi:hypothetical protein
MKKIDWVGENQYAKSFNMWHFAHNAGKKKHVGI